mmetsp:Transcript_8385/g.25207  ORF Transcript_8385/g.25207 Transcript_8385/m.25207 type:complete len:88 (+) Transcript_8385:1101-1364(+)
MKDNVSSSDYSMLEKEIQNTLAWLEENENASKEEYQQKHKSLESIVNPVFTNMHRGAGNNGNDFSAGGNNSSGPKIDSLVQMICRGS